MSFGCAAFHPKDDNIVYLFHGTDETGAVGIFMKYDIKENSFEEFAQSGFIARNLACVSYLKQDGKPVS